MCACACVSVFYIFLHGLVQLGAVFCIDVVFFVDKIHRSKHKIHHMFKLFCYISGNEINFNLQNKH